jgi:hypothetical protein
MNRRYAVAALIGSFFLVDAVVAQTATSSKYPSPYRIRFSYSEKELIGDLAQGRGNPQLSSELPFAAWYAPATKTKYGAWGPPSVHFPAPKLPRNDADFLRQRVLAVALKFQGYGYQHHHLPDWDPPADWPWKEVGAGKNGKGVDCSNFTAFVYNLALGIKPTGDCDAQAELTTIPGPGVAKTSPVKRIELPEDRDQLMQTLKPGDLLFVRGEKTEKVTHVVIWVGAGGSLADGSPAAHPLVIDSHGGGAKDQLDQEIPEGVYLRPVRPRYWYYRRACHALRIIPDETTAGR